MRLLLDTNVLVAAFLSRGQCADLFEHGARRHTLVSSAPLVAELRHALGDKLELGARETRAAVALVTSRGTIVEPAKLAEPACRDPDDDVVLGTAIAGACACIVTGDRDLLELTVYEGIPILRPADFWRFEAMMAENESR